MCEDDSPVSDRPAPHPDPAENGIAGGARLTYGQTKRVRPKTYQVAIYLVLAVFVVQFAFFLSIPWFRHRIAIDTHSPAVEQERLKAQAQAQAPTAIPLPSLTPSAPARIAVPPAPAPDPARRIDNLVREGYGYMQQGENDLARSALLEAEGLSPKDLRILCYQAELAETERDYARATSYWKRIIDLGAAAGPLVDQAKGRIADLAGRLSGASSSLPVPPPAPASASSGSGTTPQAATTVAPPAAPAPSPAQETAAPSPAAPVLPPGGKYFTVLAPTQVAADDGSGFVLRIPIVCAIQNGAIGVDPGKVSIKLYFYDRLPDGALSPTASKIDVVFENGRATWQDGRSETLRATYRRRSNATVDPKTAPAYYGYVFRLTYDGIVQDERADPAPLLRTVFPAPATPPPAPAAAP